MSDNSGDPASAIPPAHLHKKSPRRLYYLQSSRKARAVQLGSHSAINSPCVDPQPRGSSPHPPTSTCLAMSFSELRTRNNAGEEVSFEAFAGKVVLAVNVARL